MSPSRWICGWARVARSLASTARHDRGAAASRCRRVANVAYVRVSMTPFRAVLPLPHLSRRCFFLSQAGAASCQEQQEHQHRRGQRPLRPDRLHELQ